MPRSESDYNRSARGKALRAAHNRARKRAMTRLIHAHPTEFKRYLTIELQSEPEYWGRK